MIFEEQYKVVKDNLGEYSIITKDNVMIVTEIPYKSIADTVCRELNLLYFETEELKVKLKEALRH